MDHAAPSDAEPEEKVQQDRNEEPDPKVPAWAQKFEPGYGLSASPEALPAAQPETVQKGGRGDAYGRLIQRRLNSNLVIPQEVMREKVVPPVVYVTIDRSGTMREVTLIRSSGSSALDGAVLNAIRASFPVPPFPAGVPGDSVTLPLTLSFAHRD
ncbi:MAG: TonB C-terminal domain-containing protein [Parvibaculum sp.]|nr:TonB C-terminal domain-containing protein [Parvibaculum sp.]